MKNQFGKMWTRRRLLLMTFSILMMVNKIDCLSILEHFAEPAVVSNCTSSKLTCRLDTPSPAADVWWTFRGENASKLADVVSLNDGAHDGLWQLDILCPTLDHAGSYACNAQARNESELVYRKEIILEVFVPVSVEVERKESYEKIDSKGNLSCQVTAYPSPSIQWEKDNQVLHDHSERIEIKATDVNVVTIHASVVIDPLTRKDNGTYICRATNSYNESWAAQQIIVIEPPEVSFDVAEPHNPRTVYLQWQQTYHGNLPVKEYHLEMKNFTEDAKWLPVKDHIPANITEYTVQNLSPSISYSFRIAAVNEAGTGDWDALNVTMPVDVPSQVKWVHILATTNETLLFGWRRPNEDNGGNITHYQMRVTRSGQVVSNDTKYVTAADRSNYMYIVVNLEPGQIYKFQVQACSIIGCGNWSDDMEATTNDGTAEPPLNVHMLCLQEDGNRQDYVLVTWEEPENPRGKIQGYNITLEGYVKEKKPGDTGPAEPMKSFDVIKGNSFEFKRNITPNTNYSVRVCTLNRAGCGILSFVTNNATCSSPPNVPESLPEIKLQKIKGQNAQLRLFLDRISERNGIIQCYRIVVIKLPGGHGVEFLPKTPKYINITNYNEVHKTERSFGAYIAESFASEKFTNEIVIGDGRFNFSCNSTERGDLSLEIRSRRMLDSPFEWATEYQYVYDGALAPNTNYTGYLDVRVLGANGKWIFKQSPYFKPMQTEFLPVKEEPESQMVVVVGVLCGLILMTLVLVIILCTFKRKTTDHYNEEGNRVSLTSLLRRKVQRNGHIPRSKGSHISKLPNLNPVNSDDLPAAYIERHVDSDLLFQSEFEALPEKFRDRTTNASDSPENLSKNRYPDIKAYDQTRVRLPMIDGITGSDYVNANFIEGYNKKNMYICAQGPLEHTVVSFWRMIWEHKVSVIVMLTGIEEHGKVKCAQYWSDEGTKEIEKLYTITLRSVKKFSDYVMRKFLVQQTKDSITEEREVLQFHFLMWKDFLAPEQPSWLLRFIKRVNEHYCSDRGPLLTHCSAGVGRTGTFVAIDILLQQLDDDNIVDVYGCVSKLRHQRNFLVQSLKQYIFVYRALMELAQFGDTEIEVRHFRDHFMILKDKVGDTNKTGLELEFEKLGAVIEDPKTCCVGTMDMNMNKNRYNFIIPYDVNRVILPPSPSRDHSSYINASFIQGYDRSLSFIITQDPLEITFTEFWRMHLEQGITTIVMLSELGEAQVTYQTKCQQYWPEDEKEFDYVRVKFIKREDQPQIIKREFTIQNTKNNEKHTIVHFQFLGWTGQTGVVPQHTSALLSLIDQVQSNQEQNVADGPVTVHCSGGGDRSSVFVTLAVLIQQLRIEERVDVFQAARYTRSQRHCMLQTLAQYEFLHRGLLEYIESRNLCDMGDTPL